MDKPLTRTEEERLARIWDVPSQAESECVPDVFLEMARWWNTRYERAGRLSRR